MICEHPSWAQLYNCSTIFSASVIILSLPCQKIILLDCLKGLRKQPKLGFTQGLPSFNISFLVGTKEVYTSVGWISFFGYIHQINDIFLFFIRRVKIFVKKKDISVRYQIFKITWILVFLNIHHLFINRISANSKFYLPIMLDASLLLWANFFPKRNNPFLKGNSFSQIFFLLKSICKKIKSKIKILKKVYHNDNYYSLQSSNPKK